MRKIYLTVLFLSIVFKTLSAQMSEQETNLMRSILKSEVKVFFAQNMKLKSNEANQFWEIYDLYEKELLPVGNRRLAILQEMIEGNGEMSESDVERLIKEAIKVEQKRSKVRKKYYKIYKKKMGTGIAAQFYQLDVFINTKVGAAIQEGSPMVVPMKEREE